MRAVMLSVVIFGLACPPARGQQVTGDRVFGQVVTIEISGVIDELHEDEITRRVPQLMDPGEFVTRFYNRDGLLIARVAPIKDVKAFAARIDFGKVTRVSGRTIYVRIGAIAGAGSAAADPLNRALEAMNSSSAEVRESGLRQLAGIAPIARRRSEVLQALTQSLSGSDMRTTSLVIKALGVWGTRDDVPMLLRLLNAQHPGPRLAAIEALGQLRDPAAIEPVARRLAHRSDRSSAVKALVAFGPAAESAALRTLAGKDSTARAGACEVLEKIGTRQSVAALQAATQDADRAVRSAAEDALKAVSRRLR